MASSVCAGFNGMITVGTNKGGTKLKVEVPASTVAKGHRVQDKWMTQARVDKSSTVYWVVMSRTCNGGVEKNGVSCDSCAGVGALQSYRDVVRRAVFGCNTSKVRARGKRALKQLTSDARAKRLKRLLSKVGKLQRPTRREVVTERSLRKDLRGVAGALRDIQMSMAELDVGDDAVTAMSIAQDVMTNVMRKPNGRRHCQKARALAAVVRSASGEALYNCISKALILPHEAVARRILRQNDGLPYCASASREDLVFVIKMLKACMAVLGLKPGSVPFSLAEDETAVNMAVEVDLKSDLVLGTDGALCKQRCTHITICRGKRCPDPHACDPSGAYAWKMGDDFEAFDRKVKGSRMSTMARAVLINPLHGGLPPVCVLWTGTCGTFTAKGYILPQWRRLEKGLSGSVSLVGELAESVETVLGPCIGHSSDGASTRRLAMMWRSRLNDFGLRINGLEAYVFCGSDPSESGNGRTMLNMDMDFIHNIKKLINSFASASRTLQLGPDYVATMEHLRGIIVEVEASMHGARATDLNRKGFRAMRFESALRLLTTKFLAALDNAIAGTLDDREADPTLLGVRVFLGVVHRYTEIFLSRRLLLAERVTSAGYVNAFLLIWHGWCVEFEKAHNTRVDSSVVDPGVVAELAALKGDLKEARKEARAEKSETSRERVKAAKKAYDEVASSFQRRKDKGETFVTLEAMKDAVLSCHFIVHLLKWFRENAPDLAIPFWRLGTDCLEDLFSLLGSYIMNKRTYTIREGLQTLRSKLTALLIALLNKVPVPKRERMAKTEWVEDEARCGDQLGYLSDADLAKSWNKGVKEARSDLERLGMKPVRRGRGALPEWWTNPERQVPMPGDDAGDGCHDRSEEDIVREDAAADDDVDDYDVEDGADDDVDDDDEDRHDDRGGGGCLFW